MNHGRDCIGAPLHEAPFRTTDVELVDAFRDVSGHNRFGHAVFRGGQPMPFPNVQ